MAQTISPLTAIAREREAFEAWTQNLPKQRRNVARRGARALLNFWTQLHEDGLRPEDVVRVAAYANAQAQYALDAAQAAKQEAA